MNKQAETIVLAGGCFDILHPGHVIFLQKAKKSGDKLVVLLESDDKIKQIKGLNRPFHTQKDRALVLKALKCVDLVVLLPFIKTDLQYEKIIKKINPSVIATTIGDPNIHHKKRIAKLTGAKLKYVTKMIGTYSTSKIVKFGV